MNSEPIRGWAALKSAAQEFKNWAKHNQISLSRVENVATFESWLMFMKRRPGCDLQSGVTDSTKIRQPISGFRELRPFGVCGG
jgi:hypothetical protein